MTSNGFRATVRRQGSVPVIDLEGEVNSFADAALNQAFSQAVAGSPPAVVLNFAGVSYMNSTGIALIVALLAQARKTRLELRVTGLTSHYRHIFAITRLSDFMSIYDDEVSALDSATSTGA